MEEESCLIMVSFPEKTMRPIRGKDRGGATVVASLYPGAREPLVQSSTCHDVALVEIDRGDGVNTRPERLGHPAKL